LDHRSAGIDPHHDNFAVGVVDVHGVEITAETFDNLPPFIPDGEEVFAWIGTILAVFGLSWNVRSQSWLGSSETPGLSNILSKRRTLP
jgi:hypothetical protein